MKRLILALVSGLALCAATAHAQMSGGAGGGLKLTDKYPAEVQAEEERKQADEVDKRYRAVVKNTGKGEVAPKADPWAGARTVGQPANKHQ